MLSRDRTSAGDRMSDELFALVRALIRVGAPLALLAVAACQSAELPSAPAPGGKLAPSEALRSLTGATSTNIMPLAPPGDPQQYWGDARGLNDAGQVTGTVQTLGEFRPYLWSASTGVFTIITQTCCPTQVGTDVNDLGVAVGSSDGGPGGAGRGWVFEGGVYTTLSILPGLDQFRSARAVAINDAGVIVGSSQITTGPTHAVLWDDALVIQDLGTLGGTNSAAIDINASGQVIGSSQTAGNAATHFFLWSAGTGMQDLNTIIDPNVTSVVEINAAGQIIGSYTTTGGQSHAFLYTPGSGLLDLGTLGGTTSAPTGLNDNGQVVGSSTLADGTMHAFLWTPTDGMEDITAITGVPEVRRLNDNLQTLTGTAAPTTAPNSSSRTLPQLVQLQFTPSGGGGGENAPPVAAFTWSCERKKCSFDASGSTDDHGIVSYVWDFDKDKGGGKTHGVKTHTTYPKGGTHDVMLTVTDTNGQTNSVTHTVALP